MGVPRGTKSTEKFTGAGKYARLNHGLVADYWCYAVSMLGESCGGDLVKKSLGARAKKSLGAQQISLIDIDHLRPSAAQPRTDFNDEKIQELAASIAQYGILQPLLVRKSSEDQWEIIAGERRWRAAKLARLSRLPCLLVNLVDEQALAVALVENIQREDLNPIEEALAYRRLLGLMRINQEELAARVGKDRASVANSMRLLRLSPSIQSMVVKSELSMGHARALLALDSEDMMMMVAKKVLREGLSVRRLEALIRSIKSGSDLWDKKNNPTIFEQQADPILQEIKKALQAELGLKTDLKKETSGAYLLTINFQSAEQLNGLLEKLAVEI